MNTDPRTEVFLQIIAELWRLDDSQIRKLADDAGVHYMTLYSWRYARTTHPRINTLVKVAAQLGYELTLKKVRKLRAVA